MLDHDQPVQPPTTSQRLARARRVGDALSGVGVALALSGLATVLLG